MPIIHNLSNPADNLSGFDPVANFSNGTTIGRSWLLWKIFEGFSAFFPNFKKITGNPNEPNPDPTFLRNYVGQNLQTEPPLDRSDPDDYIRFYDMNDPGLNLSPPNAFVYEWSVLSTRIGESLIGMKILHVKEGDLFNPFNENSLCNINDDINSNLYIPNFDDTTTNMLNIPKIIFWKSNNAYAMIAIDKITRATKGYGLFFLTNLSYQGYKNDVGAITHNANDFHLSVLLTGSGLQFIEGTKRNYGTDPNSMLSNNVNYITHLSSMGRTPTAFFNFNSKPNVIGGYYRIGYTDLTSVKAVSDPIEGLLLCNPTLVSNPIGSIAVYNNKYYLLMGNINDGVNKHRVLLELGTL